VAAGLGWWLMREAVQPRTLLAAAISLVGVAVIVAGGWSAGSILGDAVALAMTVANALYMVLIRLFRQTAAVWAGGVSAFQLFVLGWLVVDPLAVSQQDAVLLILFGISFAVALILWTEGTKLIPAAESGLFGTSETPFAVLLAWLLLAEIPPPTSFIGGAIVLAAVLVQALLDASKAEPVVAMHEPSPGEARPREDGAALQQPPRLSSATERPSFPDTLHRRPEP
jgi:drug/metabolite transporter (DMT)-like permease